MQTNLIDAFKATPQGQEADAILRSCVHCGFCTATCPTYQLLGDELDGPRGRIYLLKQVMEGHAVTAATQLHMDRCLTCRACETACPSGVKYGRLAEIGKELIEHQVPRSSIDSGFRYLLRSVLPYRERFGPLLRVGQLVRMALPSALQKKIPARQTAKPWPNKAHKRFVILFQGCAQSCATPNTNAATARVLDRLGIAAKAIANEGCCGALSLHLTAKEEALQFMKRNIDAWWPQIEQGAEAIINTASGCGTVLKDYAEQLKHEPHYAEKARRISALVRDIGEYLAQQDLSAFRCTSEKRVAFHSPCTLQHGQRLAGSVETILTKLGYTLTNVPDSHLCCGSAGTYSLLQKELSQRLLNNKVAALQSDRPQVIATANVGCQLHIGGGADIPVRHWIELVDEGAGS